MATNKKTAAASGQFSWAQAARDVFVAAIDRGQLPVLILGLTVLMFVWKLPEAEVGPLMQRVLARLEDGSLVGWLLAAALATSWYLQARIVRRKFVEALANAQQEAHRIAQKGGR